MNDSLLPSRTPGCIPLIPVIETEFDAWLERQDESLRRWLAAFDRKAGAIRAQGFPERFIRCWRFYLAYCAAGFDSGTIDVSQYTLGRR